MEPRCSTTGVAMETDVALLKSRGVPAHGWDPHFAPGETKRAADIVNLAFVPNVIEDTAERAEVLKEAWSLSQWLRALGDGYLTRKNTFQKFYAPGELQKFASDVLGVAGVPLAPGLLAVFRKDEDRQACAARQFRRVSRRIPARDLAVALYKEHDHLFQRLLEFITERGRFPAEGEWPEEETLGRTVGSKRAPAPDH